MTIRKIIICLVFGVVFGGFAMAQKNDSLNHITLREVEIKDSAIENIDSKSSTFKIERLTIEKSGALSVGEAAKLLSGVNVKDYGGMGGIKTVSVRGLGSGHSAVVYDGVGVVDCSSTGVDLGKFSSANVSSIDLYNGQSTYALQTARSLASANVLVIETLPPCFDSLHSAYLKLGTSYGSFNYSNLDIDAAKRISTKWISQFNASVSNTSGAYPYTIHYGYSSTDSTSKERRENSDYFASRVEWNNFFSINNKTDIKLKAYWFYSERGLPNNTSFYYLKSAQRLWDNDLFLQASLTHSFSQKLQYRFNAKTSYSYQRYLDTHVSNIEGYQNDKYHQREYYANNTLAFKLCKHTSLSLTNDLAHNNLNNNATFYRSASRNSALSALVFLYDDKKLTINANALHTFTADYANENTHTSFQRHLSPFVSVGYSFPFGVSVSAFYKNIFRLPSFSELYFNRVSDSKLNPETANQINLHALFSRHWGKREQNSLNISVDLYHNEVKDKIVAVPRNNLFIWSIINYGVVQIKGLDIMCQSNIYFSDAVSSTLRFTYSYQKAVDKTNSKSSTYNNQIPYVPCHSATAFLDIQNPIAEVSLTTQFVAERYSLGENIAPNRLKPYIDQSITVSKSFNICSQPLTISLQCLNVFGVQYEVVQSYPMPQRQWRISLKTKF